MGSALTLLSAGPLIRYCSLALGTHPMNSSRSLRWELWNANCLLSTSFLCWLPLPGIMWSSFLVQPGSSASWFAVGGMRIHFLCSSHSWGQFPQPTCSEWGGEPVYHLWGRLSFQPIYWWTKWKFMMQLKNAIFFGNFSRMSKVVQFMWRILAVSFWHFSPSFRQQMWWKITVFNVVCK